MYIVRSSQTFLFGTQLRTLPVTWWHAHFGERMWGGGGGWGAYSNNSLAFAGGRWYLQRLLSGLVRRPWLEHGIDRLCLCNTEEETPPPLQTLLLPRFAWRHSRATTNVHPSLLPSSCLHPLFFSVCHGSVQLSCLIRKQIRGSHGGDWVVTPCCLVEVHRSYRGTYCLHLQAKLCLLPAGYLLSLYLNPEDGGRIFLRNFSELLPEYTALHPRSQHSS
jgi:hypothetical protein